MRIRTAFAAALLLPSLASAQGRRPRIGGGRPEVAPLGPQPEVIAKAVAIQRSKFTFESYPLLSRMAAPTFAGGKPVSNWTVGGGTRADYRLTSLMSWTLDMTASTQTGTATTQTIETGMRFRPENWDYRVRPFADLRVGYENSSDAFATDVGIGPASSLAPSMRYSHGFGAIAGAGLEYALTNTFAITTGVSAMRANMNAYNYSFTSVPTADDRFRMTTYRFTLGLKYNAVRTVALRQASESLH
jgi:hypothetical protein